VSISGQSGHYYKEKTENIDSGRADEAVVDTAMGYPQSVDYSKCQRANTGSQIKSNIASTTSRHGTSYRVSPQAACLSLGVFAPVTVITVTVITP
jgi:hypothetical protein